jgi:hypothetical protein
MIPGSYSPSVEGKTMQEKFCAIRCSPPTLVLTEYEMVASRIHHMEIMFTIH